MANQNQVSYLEREFVSCELEVTGRKAPCYLMVEVSGARSAAEQREEAIDIAYELVEGWIGRPQIVRVMFMKELD